MRNCPWQLNVLQTDNTPWEGDCYYYIFTWFSDQEAATPLLDRYWKLPLSGMCRRVESDMDAWCQSSTPGKEARYIHEYLNFAFPFPTDRSLFSRVKLTFRSMKVLSTSSSSRTTSFLRHLTAKNKSVLFNSASITCSDSNKIYSYHSNIDTGTEHEVYRCGEVIESLAYICS